MGSQYNPALDGLRGLAVLAVLLFHTKVPGFSGGGAGVDVFFVLSGYLVTRMLADGRLGVGEFWRRRARRLGPALVILLAVYCAAGPFLFGSPFANVTLEAAAAGLYLTDFTTLGRSDFPPLNHTWSLAVEAQFYLLWPLALPIFKRARDPVFALLLAWAALTLARTACIPFSARVAEFSPLHSTGILLGACVALKPPSARWAPIGLAVLGVVFVLGRAMVWAIPAAEIAAASLLPALTSTTRIAQVFSWRPAVELGVISYGVYLWHHPIFQLLTGSPFVAPLTLGLSVVIAAASYNLVERRVSARPINRIRAAPT